MSLIVAKVTEKKVEAICDGYRFKGQALVNNNIEKIVKINEETIVGGVGCSCLLDIFKNYCINNYPKLITENFNRDFLLKFVNDFLQEIITKYSKLKIDETDLMFITKKGIFSYTVYDDMSFIPIEYDGCNKLALGVGRDYANSLLDLDIDLEAIMNKCLEKFPSLGGKITKIEF